MISIDIIPAHTGFCDGRKPGAKIPRRDTMSEGYGMIITVKRAGEKDEFGTEKCHVRKCDSGIQ